MKIYLDFDRVAFDTDRLYELLEDATTPTGESIALGTIESLDYLDGLADGYRVGDLLFPDFVEFAQRQRERGNELVLVSSAVGFSDQWDLIYQREKIKRSGIDDYMDRELLVEEGKRDAIRADLADGKPAWFLEDKPEHLRDVFELAREGLPIRCAQIQRKTEHRTKDGIESIEPVKEFETFKGFAEFENYLHPDESVPI